MNSSAREWLIYKQNMFVHLQRWIKLLSVLTFHLGLYPAVPILYREAIKRFPKAVYKKMCNS